MPEEKSDDEYALPVQEKSTPRSELIMVMWVFIYFSMIILLGFYVSIALFTVLFLYYFGRENWKMISIFTVSLWTFVYITFVVGMKTALYGGVLGYMLEYFSG